MFSSRIAAGQSLNDVSRVAAQLRRSGRTLLDLTSSNPTTADFAYPDDVLAAMADARSLVYSPDSQGLFEARQAVSEYLDEKVPPAQIVLTASTSEAYSYLFKLLCDPGDQILVPAPSYPLFEFLARLESTAVRHYGLFYDHGWHVDLGSVEVALQKSQLKALVVVNPNNPTGSYLKRVEFAGLIGLCKRYNVALICDEVFRPFSFGEDAERVETVAGMSEVLTFTLSGLSKIAGLPQMKLGWIAASGPEPLLREAMARLELIADTFLSVGTPVQWALQKLLRGAQMLQGQITSRARENLQTLEKVFAGTPIRTLKVEGGWSAVLQVTRVRPEEAWVIELLEQRSVLVQPGFFYDFPAEAYLICSLLTRPEVFRRGLLEIAAL